MRDETQCCTSKLISDGEAFVAMSHKKLPDSLGHSVSIPYLIIFLYRRSQELRMFGRQCGKRFNVGNQRPSHSKVRRARKSVEHCIRHAQARAIMSQKQLKYSGCQAD